MPNAKPNRRRSMEAQAARSAARSEAAPSEVGRAAARSAACSEAAPGEARSSAGVFDRNRIMLGCFVVAGRVLAIDVTQLREVVRWQPVTPLPRAPALIEGVVDLRGTVVPVVDLGRALGGKPIATGPRARIAVTDVDGLLVGLVVDAAVEVVAVEAASLEDPPALAIQAGYEATRAVVRRNGAEPILVLSLEHLLEFIYRSALPAEAVA